MNLHASSFRLPAITSAAEIIRVRNLPVRAGAFYPDNLVAQLTALLKTPGGEQTLFDVQARALYDLGMSGETEHGKRPRLFAPIKVAGGKSLISLLAPRMVTGVKRPRLMLPASMVTPTLEKMRVLGKHWRVAKHMKIWSYQKIGRKEGMGVMEFEQPDMLILDEAHFAKNPRAAVTRKLARYFKERPETILVILTGTPMKDSVKNFAHLLQWAHGQHSPLPLNAEALREWAEVLDEGLNPMAQRDPGALLDLYPAPADADPDPVIQARQIFKARLNDTLSVIVADGKDEYGGSLEIEALEYTPNAATEANFKKLRDDMCRPDDWALTEAMQVWAVARMLALGLHYRWWDQKGFSKCLNQMSADESGCAPTRNTQNEKGRLAAPLMRAILNAAGKVTANGIGLERALAVRQNAPYTGYGTDTSLPPNNIRPSGISSTAHATYVEKCQVNPELVARFSRWTTATSPTELEACFAQAAIEASGFWETLLTAFPELSPILQQGVEAAGPPPEWLLKRKLWAAFVRDTLASPRSVAEGWDSELQVVNAVLGGRLEDDFGLLADWQAIRPTFDVNPVPVWHDPTALKVCAYWLADHDRGIVWVDHRFFGKALSDMTGITYYGAKGLDSKGNFVEAHPSGPIIVSRAANSTGRDLQHKWDANLVTAPAPDSDAWEQLIARTHRYGQKADAVTVDVLVGCREHLESIPRALSAADVKKDLLGFQQKLRFADRNWPDLHAPRAGKRWA
jgi:hypothetical protein